MLPTPTFHFQISTIMWVPVLLFPPAPTFQLLQYSTNIRKLNNKKRTYMKDMPSNVKHNATCLALSIPFLYLLSLTLFYSYVNIYVVYTLYWPKKYSLYSVLPSLIHILAHIYDIYYIIFSLTIQIHFVYFLIYTYIAVHCSTHSYLPFSLILHHPLLHFPQ